jgi:drug/metabolite transporter (DMT)-like permease
MRMHKSRTKTWAHLSMAGAYLIYGLNFSVAKGIMPDYIKPLALVSIRTIIAAALFWLTGLFMPKESVSRKDLLYLFGCSFLGVVINQISFLAGLNLTTPINSSIILTINPIAVFVFAAFILKEEISLLRGVGLAVGLGGVLLLILQGGRPDIRSSTFLGDLFSLASTINWALYTVLIKRMMEKYHPVTVMKWTFFFGVFATFPIGYSQLIATDWTSIPLNVWFSIIFIVFGATFIGYLLISHGLRSLSPTVVSSYAYTQPLVASFVASMLGQDKIDLVKIVSAGLIFTGVFLVSRQNQNGFNKN